MNAATPLENQPCSHLHCHRRERNDGVGYGRCHQSASARREMLRVLSSKQPGKPDVEKRHQDLGEDHANQRRGRGHHWHPSQAEVVRPNIRRAGRPRDRHAAAGSRRHYHIGQQRQYGACVYSCLDLDRAPYVVYGVKYNELVSLGACAPRCFLLPNTFPFIWGSLARHVCSSIHTPIRTSL